VDKFQLKVLVLSSVAVVGSMMAAGLFGVFFIGSLGAALTVGFKTGSLAPVIPTISRTEAPSRFWLVMSACAAVVALNIVNLFWRS